MPKNRFFDRKEVCKFPDQHPVAELSGSREEQSVSRWFLTRRGAARNKFLFALVVVFFCCLGWQWLQTKYAVPILMYHKVENVPNLGADVVSPKVFEWQMKYLKEHGYSVVPLEQIISLIAASKPLPRRTVVLTFDDGYENFFTQAFPVLKSYGYPVTLFVSAGRTTMAGYLNWDQMLTMQKEGITFASHGMDHFYLPNASPERRRLEIFESKKLLEQHLGRPVDIYCYAVGGFNKDIKALVREAGYRAAITTNRGSNHSNQDLYELRRIKLSDKDRLSFIMWVKLSGYYNLLRKPKNPG